MIIEIPDEKIAEWNNLLKENKQDTPEDYPDWIRLIIECVDNDLQA